MDAQFTLIIVEKNDCLGPNSYLDPHRKFPVSCPINSVCLNVRYMCVHIYVWLYTHECVPVSGGTLPQSCST